MQYAYLTGMIWKCTFLKNTTERNFKLYHYQEKGECSRSMMIITYAKHAVRVHIYKGLAFYYSSIHIPISTYHLYCLVFQSRPHLYSDESRPLHRGGSHTYMCIHTCTYIHVLFIWSSRPWDKVGVGGGGGDLKNNFFGPFRPQSGPKLRGSPRPLPWIHHCYNNPSTHFIFLPLQI